MIDYLDNKESKGGYMSIENMRFVGLLDITYTTTELGFKSTVTEEMDFLRLKEVVSRGCKIKLIQKPKKVKR